jgi:hypothetical protein
VDRALRRAICDAPLLPGRFLNRAAERSIHLGNLLSPIWETEGDFKSPILGFDGEHDNVTDA